MTSFDTKDSLLESVNSLFHSLNKGELSLNELETLVNQTRELYERAIVLRHKAYEKSVIKNLDPHILVPLEEVVETPIENVPEIISETIDKQENLSVKEFEQPTFDMSFSLFDELESESKPLEDTNEEVIIPENVQMTETVVEPIVEIKEEIAVVEPVVGSQLMAKKLDSLTGAFGLNEKLQMTHELFNGSSESFYQAVQLFDTLDNFSQAKDVLNKFKEEFSWNLETTLVTEFVQKIARRYA